MNNKNHHIIEIICDHEYAIDVAEAIIHSIVFFRSFGKFKYSSESSYSIGSIGFEQINCKSLDFTYIRSSSRELALNIDGVLLEFSKKLDERRLGQAILLLEFYTKKPNRWPFSETKIVWESWTLKILTPQLLLMDSRQQQPHHFPDRAKVYDKHYVEETLRRKMIDIIGLINRTGSFLPPMPKQSDFENTFDPIYKDLQPYLFSISWKICDISDKPYTNEHTPNDISIQSSESRRSSLTRFLLGTLEL